MFTPKKVQSAQIDEAILTKQIEAAAKWWSEALVLHDVRSGNDYKSKMHRQLLFTNYTAINNKINKDEFDRLALKHYARYEIDTDEKIKKIKNEFYNIFFLKLFDYAYLEFQTEDSFSFHLDRGTGNKFLYSVIEEAGLEKNDLPIAATMTIYRDARVVAILGKGDQKLIFDASNHLFSATNINQSCNL